MTPEEKKLEKLNKLLEIANEDFATPEELIQLSESILGIITLEKNRVRDELKSLELKDKADTEKVIALLNEKEKSLKYLISELGRSYSDNDEIISNKFAKEIKRLERKIPSRVDLTEIYNAIDSLKQGINNFPTELTINNQAIRDGLELLPDGEKLDINAIQDLRKILDELAKKHGGKSDIIAGVRYLSYLADVNVSGITDGQGIAWSASLGKFIPATFGGGSGSGVTVTTPTGTVNGSNVTFTSSVVAKWIDTDTGHYYPNFGYTRSGTTYELDLAPNSYIYLIS